MWCDLDSVWCHPCAKCDDLHTCCDAIDRVIHRYRCVCHLCDDTDTVAVRSNMVGEMPGIVAVLSWKQYGDSICIGNDVINMLGVMLYTEGYDVINSCWTPISQKKKKSLTYWIEYNESALWDWDRSLESFFLLCTFLINCHLLIATFPNSYIKCYSFYSPS